MPPAIIGCILCTAFVKSQARHIFIFIQSLLDSRPEDVATRFSTAEGLHSFIIEFLAEKVGKKEPEEEKSSFGGNVSGEVVALASSVNKEVLSKSEEVTDAAPVYPGKFIDSHNKMHLQYTHVCNDDDSWLPQ